MDSNSIAKIPGSNPERWVRLEVGASPPTPPKKGVYVIRLAGGKRFGRVRRESDLVYVSQGDFVSRIRAQINPRTDLKDRGWHLALIGQQLAELGLEVGFCPCADPKKMEGDLLYSYLTDHLELPPVNNQMPKLPALASMFLYSMGMKSGDRDMLIAHLRKDTSGSKDG